MNRMGGNDPNDPIPLATSPDRTQKTIPPTKLMDAQKGRIMSNKATDEDNGPSYANKTSLIIARGRGNPPRLEILSDPPPKQKGPPTPVTSEGKVSRGTKLSSMLPYQVVVVMLCVSIVVTVW